MPVPVTTVTKYSQVVRSVVALVCWVCGSSWETISMLGAGVLKANYCAMPQVLLVSAREGDSEGRHF